MASSRKFGALDMEEQLDHRAQQQAEIQYKRQVEDVRKRMEREREDEALKRKSTTEEVQLRLQRAKEDNEILLRRIREDEERVTRLEDGVDIISKRVIRTPIEDGLSRSMMKDEKE